MDDVTERLHAVEESIATAAAKTGRPRDEIALVAVSKTHGAEAVREIFDCGQRVFGESRVQELLAKAPLLPEAVRWHFIGHLQKNKIRKALPLCELVHGVDSAELAEDIDRIAGELGLYPRVLLEINVSGEGTKFGFTPETLRSQFENLLRLSRVQVEGFMTIAPYSDDPEHSRPHFVALRKLRDEMAQSSGVPLPVLSMGMSGDFQIAIEEGASLVRVGTAIFGDRRAR
jgi:pyridoxal phosphate enzyme (YggS family)